MTSRKMNRMVSVVIPAYNAETTIQRTLQSVLDQTHDRLEVIVVDDGSTDNTVPIAEQMRGPIQVLRQANQGVSNARNRGISVARGGYLALLDADDVWHPTKIEKQLLVLEKETDAMGVYAGVLRVSASDQVIERLPATNFEDLCRSLLLHSSVIPNSPSNLLLRREVFDVVGLFDPRFSQCADWDLLIRLSLKVHLEPLQEWLVRYRTAAGNMSSDISLLEKDTFAVLDKFYASEESTPYLDIKDRVYSNHWLILSGSYLHNRQPGDSARCLLRALREDPTNVRYPLSFPSRAFRRMRSRGRSRRRDQPEPM